MRERVIELASRLKSGRVAISAMFAMAIKAGGALLTLVIFTVAARAMSADEFGRLAIWFNVVSFIAVAAVCGQDTLIARSFGEYAGRDEHGLAWGAYRFGWILTIFSGFIFLAALLTIGPALFPKFSLAALAAPAFFLFTQTLLHYSSHSTRVIVNFVVSEISRELIWRSILFVALVWAVLHRGLTPAEFFIAGGLGQIVSLVVALHYVRRAWRPHVAAPIGADHVRLWFSRSFPMWQSAILEGSSLYVDVMLIGYVASPAEAGDYFVAQRIANVFLMVGGGLNTYTFAHSSNLYFSGQVEKLQSILRSLVSVSVTMLAPVLLLIYAFGSALLTIFGARYSADYQTLVVLATGCFIMSVCGSAPIVLLTTGEEKLYSRIIGFATIARISLTALLAWRFGAPGAAFGWALVNAPLHMALAGICRRKIGVDPSVLSIIARLSVPPRAGASNARARG